MSTGAGEEPGEIRIITVPAPGADPLRLLGLDGGTGVFWGEPGGPVHAGLGAAATVTGNGPERFSQVRAGARRLWDRLRCDTDPAGPVPSPRLYGGLAFLPGQATGPWCAFGDATFVLPAVQLTVDDAGARLSIAVPTGRGDAPPTEAGVRALLRQLSEAGEPRGSGKERTREAVPRSQPDPEPWVAAVGSIKDRIAAGRAAKIVAARSVAVPMDARRLVADPAPMLARLGREPAAVRFAFRMGGALFAGASPERLVRRSGRTVRTEALAGTVAAGRESELRPLLESVKESAEHEFVVRAIADALAPCCETLEYPDTPGVQRLRHVHHLRTPFEGHLARDATALDLVERLHPTPAVGGWPADEALRWIAEHEPGVRGWYAAPVGWLDAAGDGEFVVALRSGLLHDDRAELFAGAGIVADSDPYAELEETEIKLKTMRDALGLDG